MQRCVTECVAFILPLIQSKKETSKGTAPRKMGLYWDCDPKKKENNKKQHFIQSYEQRGSQPEEPSVLMASESSFPPLESLLSKARLHEQHFFRAQHHARTSAKMMTITNKSTPPPPCTCSTVKTKIPAAELLSCPVDSPVAVVTSGESTATSRGPHMLPLATFTLKHSDSLFSSNFFKVRDVQGSPPPERACPSGLLPPLVERPPPPPLVRPGLPRAALSLLLRLGGAAESR